MSRLVRVSPNAAAAARDVAAFILRELRAAIRERGHATFVAAGGSTPLEVYRLLARSRDRFPWPALDVFFGDDRYVPAESPDRNERAVREAWLDRVPLPADRIHAMPAAPAERDASSPSLDDEATRHERTLRDALAARGATARGAALFDFVLLGIGTDGHTASLFPGDPALEVEDRWVAAVAQSPTPPRVPRLTLTLEAIRAARTVAILATGESKRPVVAAILATDGGDSEARSGGTTDVGTRLPAARVRSQTGSVAWFLDAAACPEG